MYSKNVEIFIEKNGLLGLEKLRDMLNKGCPLRDVAKRFNVSIPTASRLKDSLLECVYIFSDETKAFLEYQQSRHKWISEEYKKEITNTDNLEANILKFSQQKSNVNP